MVTDLDAHAPDDGPISSMHCSNCGLTHPFLGGRCESCDLRLASSRHVAAVASVMRSISEMADAALRNDHRLLYLAQLARQAETAATAPPRAGQARNGESRSDANDLLATASVVP
jgi:hypothetical protein